VRECPGGKPGRGVKAEGGISGRLRWEGVCARMRCVLPHHRPTWIFLKGLSQSVFVGTRKIVNYG
jgi:hypothetical protein